jgi:hypothetical protein
VMPNLNKLQASSKAISCHTECIRLAVCWSKHAA